VYFVKVKKGERQSFLERFLSVLIEPLDVEYESRRKSGKMSKIAEIVKLDLTWESMGDQLIFCESEKR
jgi:hypothetical protein